MPRDVGVVLVAGGEGRRVGGELPKQFRPVGGVPMLLRALRPFVSHPEVLRTVVVLPERWAADPPEWLTGLTGGGLRIVAGGAERMDSAERGIEALPAKCAVVLVHDAARPFVSPDTVDGVIAAARLGGGAIAAAPLGDTLKECDDAAAPLVRRTIPRAGLWRAQTPQGFPRALLERAYAAARRDGVIGTDESLLVERIGGTVRVVPDAASNLKITTPEDFDLAEALARMSP
ncbi:MAG: 2-C-methyl-D-erythritol 4-phosphate cytidylyltransferase [Gemmatimonadales bacterium]